VPFTAFRGVEELLVRATADGERGAPLNRRFNSQLLLGKELKHVIIRFGKGGGNLVRERAKGGGKAGRPYR